MKTAPDIARKYRINKLIFIRNYAVRFVVAQFIARPDGRARLQTEDLTVGATLVVALDAEVRNSYYFYNILASTMGPLYSPPDKKEVNSEEMVIIDRTNRC